MLISGQVGTHRITARFIPATSTQLTSAFASGQVFTVVPFATATNVTLNRTSVANGGKVTANVTVRYNGHSAGRGMAVFFIDGKPSRTVPLNTNGNGSISVSGAVGSHKVTARFRPSTVEHLTSVYTAGRTFRVTATPVVSVLSASRPLRRPRPVPRPGTPTGATGV